MYLCFCECMKHPHTHKNKIMSIIIQMCFDMETKFPTENFVWVSKLIHLLVVSAYCSAFIYLCSIPFRSIHLHKYTTYIHVLPLDARIWLFHTVYDKQPVWNDSLELSWTVLMCLFYIFFGGGVGDNMVMMTVENVSFG